VLKDFKAFILRGNMVDLAVAVIIGVAFGLVITALVKDLLTPLIAAIGGKPDFGSLTFTVHHSTFRYGDFINQVISFVIVAASVFFFAVVPLNKMLKRLNMLPAETPTKKCPECLSDIPAAARRCAFCASEVATA
jgi:large conductance mechanosensitive channel